MRAVTSIVTLLVTSSAAVVMFVSSSLYPDESEKNNTYFTDIVETRDRALFDEFMGSLDPAILIECTSKHDAGTPIDLDHLAKAGDFDAYANYMRVSKFEAVKKFQYVLLHSSSKLEFEDRLAR